ncbi:MAG: pyridoxamine kinase [Solobacterium sp.]|nr:pyridoxamine kinase [Solobacterium sp.]
MKQIVTMQDISCVGKCSLTVALPIVSAMGIETSVIPTAVLSTHTMFQGFTFHDLTMEVKPIMEHWKKEKFHFDGVYTGFLGSFEQVELAKELIHTFSKDSFSLVDPCMADNGSLYPSFDTAFASHMATLCKEADIICPNLTEAAFLLGEEYRGNNYDESFVQETLKKLCTLGCKVAVLTGISLEEGKLGVYAYDSRSDEWFQYYRDELPEKFHGTGDIWASTFFGALTSEKGIERSLQIATDYVVECIRITLEEENHITYGVNFEKAIPYLVRLLNE